MGDVPQPFVVKVEPAEPAEAADAVPIPSSQEATKYLRETAKWIVGGIVATAGAVLAGSSLTNLGSLDPAVDGGRLGLALGGAALGFLSIGVLMAKALEVFKVSSVSLERLHEASAGSEWARLRAEVECEFGLAQEGEDSLSHLLNTPTEVPIPQIDAMLPYLYVRSKFNGLVSALPWTVLGATIGFGLYAWAANPPERKDPAPRPPAVIVNWP